MKTMPVTLFIAILAAACSAQAVQPADNNIAIGPALAPAPVELTLLRTNGEATQLAIGRKFGVALTEHPSVGWTWEVTDVSDNIRADGVIDPDFSNVPPGGDIGDKTFRFIAARPGAATLRFVHIFRGERREEVTYRVIVAG